MGNERKDREIGSKPSNPTPIGRKVEQEIKHPWNKGNTHPIKED